MGKGAQIQDGYIEVNTNAWLESRTGGELKELTDLYLEFDDAVHQQTGLSLDIVALFIVARSGADWRDDEFATIYTPDGGGTVNLSDDISVCRYVDPQHGPIAFVTLVNNCREGQPAAYADSGHDSTEWFSYHDVDIFCPDGHGWTYQASRLIDDEGTGHAVTDVFPTGDIVTEDDDMDSDTFGESQIICPTCGQHCDVEIPGA
jgi:hypothetical protein